MDERERKRKMREELFQELHWLFLLNSTGWNVDSKLRDVGHKLAPDEKHDYMPEEMTFEQLDYYLRMAKNFNVPARVFKDRLRLNHPPLQAATKPYIRKPKKNKNGPF